MFKKSLILCSFLALPLAAWSLMGAADSGLRARAERVFAYDRTHPHVLPANLIRTLSLTLEFGDEQGARTLLHKLELRQL